MSNHISKRALYGFDSLMLQTKIVVIIQIEWQIQSSGRNSIFGIFVNPIMRKVAPLIISSESNLAEELAAVETTKHS